MKVIGVTGPLGSGKTTVAKLLEAKNFVRVSLTDELREEVRKRALPETREVFIDTANALRKEFGKDILAKKASESLEALRRTRKTDKFIIDGLKNPGEVKYFKEKYDMFLIGVVAEEKIRVKRILSRSSILDSRASKNVLQKNLKRDLGIGEKDFGNNIRGTLDLADIRIKNDGSLEELEKKINELF